MYFSAIDIQQSAKMHYKSVINQCTGDSYNDDKQTIIEKK